MQWRKVEMVEEEVGGDRWMRESMDETEGERGGRERG